MTGIATRAVLLGFMISLFFLMAGYSALAFLGESVHAFSVSGGILLFFTTVPMLFGQRPALQSAETNESGPEDIAIFPLAIPLLTGPGTITSILLLTAQARGSFAKLATPCDQSHNESTLCVCQGRFEATRYELATDQLGTQLDPPPIGLRSIPRSTRFRPHLRFDRLCDLYRRTTQERR
jgi:MarC family integral membrane protein